MNSEFIGIRTGTRNVDDKTIDFFNIINSDGVDYGMFPQFSYVQDDEKNTGYINPKNWRSSNAIHIIKLYAIITHPLQPEPAPELDPEPEPSLDIYRGIIELTTNNKFSWNYTYNSSVSSNDFKFNHTADSIKWINILMDETKDYRLEIEYKISGTNNKTSNMYINDIYHSITLPGGDNNVWKVLSINKSLNAGLNEITVTNNWGAWWLRSITIVDTSVTPEPEPEPAPERFEYTEPVPLTQIAR